MSVLISFFPGFLSLYLEIANIVIHEHHGNVIVELFRAKHPDLRIFSRLVISIFEKLQLEIMTLALFKLFLLEDGQVEL